MEITTHLSVVRIEERDVYKRKRPVDLGFVDFRTLEARKAACEAEVRLNARLAPGVYLGVVPIVEGGAVVDWAVHMRRLDDARRADVLLARGELGHAAIERVAATIAAFHAAARCDEETARFGSREAVAFNVEENFRQTAAAIGEYLTDDEAHELRDFQRGVLRDRAGAFDERVRRGRVRDGHGDLRLEHVYYLDRGAPTIIDCIEFSDRFRFADVCADVAFLSMDLAAHRRVDLAELLLARYARASNDYDLYELVDFYESYRATVRGKVAAILAHDETVDDGARGRGAREARRSFSLALAADRRALLHPSVVAVGGLIATGKSTVAELVAAESSAPIVDADRTRKSMLGVAATQPLLEKAWTGAYDPKLTERVYAEVMRRADVVLRSGRPVVLDASFRSPVMRRAARELAMHHRVPFRFVECRAPAEVCRDRLAQRAREEQVSDGRAAIWDAFAARWEPATDVPDAEHVVIDTTRPEGETLANVRARLEGWPLGLAG